MRKSKFMKALLLFGMSAITATSIAFSACGGDTNDGDDKDDTATTHSHEWSGWKTDANKHWKECTAEGHEGSVKGYEGVHVWDNDEDTTCNTCGYVRTIGGEGPGGDEGETKAPVIFNASSLDISNGLTSGTELCAGVKVYGSPAVDGNTKNITFKGESVSVTKRLKLSSKLTHKDTPMGIEVNVEEAATVIVYYYSGSSDPTKTPIRGVELYNDIEGVESPAPIENTTQAQSDGTVMGTAMFSVEANTKYYIGASVAGVNVYYLAVVYGNIGETWEHHDAVPAACEVKGNIEYSVSNYGRYKNSSGTAIRSNETATDALVHSYTVKENSLTIPTNDEESNEGKVTLTCANGHETVVPLPILSSEKYTQTPIQDSTNVTYSINIGLDAPFTFEAAPAAQPKYKFEAIHSNNLFGTAISSVGYGASNAQELATGIKMYGVTNVSGATSYSEGITEAVTAAGRLEVTDTHAFDTAYTYIVFDNAKTTGVYKISGTLYLPTQNGSWSLFQLIGSNVQTTGDNAFAMIRSDGNKYLGISTTNSNDDVTLKTSAAYTKGKDITFEIVLNLTDKTVTLKIGDEEVVDADHAISVATSLGTNGWQGIRLQTAGGSRNIYLSNLVISERVLDTSEDA